MNGQFAQFIPLILIFVIFYFFLIRPQQKRVKDHKAMVESLKKYFPTVTEKKDLRKLSKFISNSEEENLLKIVLNTGRMQRK